MWPRHKSVFTRCQQSYDERTGVRTISVLCIIDIRNVWRSLKTPLNFLLCIQHGLDYHYRNYITSRPPAIRCPASCAVNSTDRSNTYQCVHIYIIIRDDHHLTGGNDFSFVRHTHVCEGIILLYSLTIWQHETVDCVMMRGARVDSVLFIHFNILITHG